jgi:hypothetical protein
VSKKSGAEHGLNEHAWRDVLHYRQDKKHLFIGLGNSLTYAIPRLRILDGDLDALLLLLQQNCGADP